jgi:chemotaxis protein methyltransferase CheR
MDHFEAFRDLIEERSGLHFDESQRASLLASVGARMVHLAVTDLGEYYERLRSRPVATVDQEFQKLLNLISITETSFFRDPLQLRLLQDIILPSLLAERAQGVNGGSGARRTLRIWSAGCSSGEEAYSIAIVLWETGLLPSHPEFACEIVGSDMNTKVLEEARRGVYSKRAVRNMEARYLHRHFRRDGTHYAINDALKACVRFEYGNLSQTPMPSTGPQDIVFCKNVAIYFQPEARRRLVAGLRDTLADGGYLVCGHAESLIGMDAGLTVVEHDRAYAYRKRFREPFSNGTEEKGSRNPVPSTPVPPDRYKAAVAAFCAGDLARAEAGLGALVAVSPLEPRAHLLLGIIAVRQHRINEAIQSLRRALYLDGSLALAHFWLGNLYRDRGEFDRARCAYENVIRGWDERTLSLTEELATDLSSEQLVAFCSDSLQRLANGTNG